MDRDIETAFHGFVRDKRSKLDALTQRRDNPSKSFICPPDILGENRREPFWSEQDLSVLFPNVSPAGFSASNIRDTHALCLAILFSTGWPLGINHSTFQDIFWAHFYGSANGIDDSSLPLPDDDGRIYDALGEPAAKTFLKTQYTFKPCIISIGTGSTSVYVDRRPLPFVEKPELVNKGGYGDIYKAEIARGCFENESGEKTGKLVAFKRFNARDELSARDDFEQERKILRAFRRSAMNHAHIAQSLSELVRLRRYYIFFKYTPLGDLETLFNAGFETSTSAGVSDRSDQPLYGFDKTFLSPHRSHFIYQLRMLAHALNWLHVEFPKENNGLMCAHMDLRPNNVLVYPKPMGDERRSNIGTWVLADFGIASFARSHSIGGVEISSPTLSPPSSPIAYTERKLSGPHRAPELQLGHQRAAYAPCDLWAFGCIINEVFAFISDEIGTNATMAAMNLQKFRHNKGLHTKVSEAWFDTNESEAHTHGPLPILNDFVRFWLEQEENQRHAWKAKMCQLIRGALQITDTQRISAETMLMSLDEIHKDLRSIETGTTTQHRGSRSIDAYQVALVSPRFQDARSHHSNPSITSDPWSTPMTGSIGFAAQEVEDFVVADDCSLVAYLLKAGSRCTVWLLKPGTAKGLDLCSSIPLPEDNVLWNEMYLKQGLLIVSGKAAGKKFSKVSRMFDVLDCRNPTSFSSASLPQAYSKLVGSYKAVAWEADEGGRTVYIWRKEHDALARRTFEGSIREISLNATSTLLYVWERRVLRNYLHMLDLTQADVSSLTRSWHVQHDLNCKIWPAQEDSFCVIQETEHGKRRLIHFDGRVEFMTELDEDKPRKSWDSAISKTALVTARSERLTKSGGVFRRPPYGIRISRRQFQHHQLVETEVDVAHPHIEDWDIRVACYSEGGIERIVVCSKSGRYHLHEVST